MFAILAGMGYKCGMGFGAYYALALFLLSLGMGYKVMAKSEKVECPCGKKFGRFLGYFITGLSLLAILCLGWRCISHCKDGKFCPRPDRDDAGMESSEVVPESLPEAPATPAP